MSDENGIMKCAVFHSWERTKEKVDEMHSSFTEYLPHLEKLAMLHEIASSNNDIRDRLISPATSSGRVEIKVIMPIIYALCFMLVAIVVWFTGVEPNLPKRGTGYQEQSK